MKLIRRHSTPSGPRTTVQQGLAPKDAYMLMEQAYAAGDEASVIEDGATLNFAGMYGSLEKSDGQYSLFEVNQS